MRLNEDTTESPSLLCDAIANASACFWRRRVLMADCRHAMAAIAIVPIGTHTVNRGDLSLVKMIFWRVIAIRVARAANVPMCAV